MPNASKSRPRSEFTDSARQNNPKLLEHMRGTRLTGEVVDETELVPPQFPGFFVSWLKIVAARPLAPFLKMGIIRRS